MNRTEFLKFIEEKKAEDLDVIRRKNEVYGADSDPFYAFKAAAEEHPNLNDPAQALLSMALKHLVTVKSWIGSGNIPSRAEAREKCGDLANYFVILEALYEAEWARHEKDKVASKSPGAPLAPGARPPKLGFHGKLEPVPEGEAGSAEQPIALA